MSEEGLRVVRGGPTAEELAALTAILAASAAANRQSSAPTSIATAGWRDPATRQRTRWPQPRPGAWRASVR